MSFRWARMIDDPFQTSETILEGFDSVHLRLDLVHELSAEAFSELEKRIADAETRADVCSGLLPPDATVSAAGFNLYVWAEYLKHAIERVARIGCRRLTWDNGRSRVLPLEGPVEEVKEQIMQFLFVTCEIAQPHGITVLVEPLGPRRTNFLNSLEEVDSFLNSVGQTNLSSMVSLRELDSIGMTLESLVKWRRRIDHVHLENPGASERKRVAPTPADGYNYGAFLNVLRQMDYSGVITLPADANTRTLQMLRTSG